MQSRWWIRGQGFAVHTGGGIEARHGSRLAALDAEWDRAELSLHSAGRTGAYVGVCGAMLNWQPGSSYRAINFMNTLLMP